MCKCLTFLALESRPKINVLQNVNVYQLKVVTKIRALEALLSLLRLFTIANARNAA